MVILPHHTFQRQLEFVGLTLFVVSGRQNRLLGCRVVGRGAQVHHREVAGLVATHGLCHAVIAVVANLEYFLK